jgi:hypothetical protein
MNDTDKIKLVSEFHRAVLRLSWAKHGRAKTASKRFKSMLKNILTEVLKREPTAEEIIFYNTL